MRFEVLCSNLCFLHGLLRASEGLLEAAIAQSDGELRSYFKRHLVEERGHLALLEQDLKGLGVGAPPLPYPIAAQLAGAQYYYIAHDHPALLLGYMAALESNPIPLSKVDWLEAEHNVTLSCARHHAIHDPEHGPELEQQVVRLESALKRRVRANESWTLEELNQRAQPMIVAEARYFKRAM